MIDSSPRFFLIGKPKGITSFDVIRRLKPFFYELYGKGSGRNKLKVGHFGTLDPFADGLLLVGVGKSLKLTELIHESLSKEYIATGIAGKKTMTGDCDGEVVEERSVLPSHDQISKSLSTFIGTYNQRPSYFSAVKHDGKPLYEYARAGIFIDKEPVKRTIYSCDFIEMNENFVKFKTKVSTGTYIRKLWEDACLKCDNIGYLDALQRTCIGELKLEDAQWLDDIKEASDLVSYRPYDVLNLKKVVIDQKTRDFVVQGREINITEDESLVWLEDEEGELVALSKRLPSGMFRSQINFLSA